jgi:hypothetical protein
MNKIKIVKRRSIIDSALGTSCQIVEKDIAKTDSVSSKEDS